MVCDKQDARGEKVVINDYNDTTILDKSPRDSTAIFKKTILKTVRPFRNFFGVLAPPTLYKVEKRVQHCLWGEGRG